MAQLMRWWRPFAIYDFIDRLDVSLYRIEGKVDRLSEQEQELDAALTDLGAKVDTLVNAVDTLIASIPHDASIDLSDEIAAVQQAALGIQGVTDKASGEAPAT